MVRFGGADLRCFFSFWLIRPRFVGENERIIPDEETVVQQRAEGEKPPSNLAFRPTATPTPMMATPSRTHRVGLVGKAAQSGVTLPAWTATPTVTAMPQPTSTPIPVSADSPLFAETKWIDVDLGDQTLIAYENNTPVYFSYLSSGLPNTPTVTGQFRIYLRLETQNMSGYHLGFDYYIPNVPYVMYFYENYALHGAYWHNNFGRPQSHGCLNLSVTDSAWLFNFAPLGTLVNIHP